MLNICFLVAYVLMSGFLSGYELFVMLSIHFGICMIRHLQRKLAINPLFVFYFGVIVVNVANMNLIDQVDARHVTTYTYIIPKYIDTAAMIWCISSTLCVVGFELAGKKSLPTIFLEIKRKKVLQNLFWFLFIANLLTIVGYGFLIKGGNQFGKIFGLINSIGILFYARLWSKEDSKQYRTYTLVLYVLETYIALISSFLRFELIQPSLYLFAGYFIGKGSMKFLFSYRILPFAGILLVFSSVFSLLQHSRSNFISVFTGEIDNSEIQDGKNSTLLDRSANLAQITNVVNLVEKNGVYGGTASAPMITALVPRVLWPDKPLIQLGAWFALEIGVGTKTCAGTANNSINMTVAGQLFLDFWWVGVVLGSLFFGAFLAILWNSTQFYASEYNLTGTIFGGYLFLLSIGSYADLQVVITLLSTYLIFLIIKKVANAI